MKDDLMHFVWAASTALLIAVIIVGAVLWALPGGSKSGPREVFEAHLLALDEGRLDDANALVDITCGRVEKADADAAKAGLEGAGYTFQTAFRVGEVWTNAHGTETILELETPPNLPLPSVQGMMLVDGEWLLKCN